MVERHVDGRLETSNVTWIRKYWTHSNKQFIMHYVVGLLVFPTAALQKLNYGYHNASSPMHTKGLLSLLGNLALNAPLQSLALIMLQLPALLLRLITSKTRESASNSTANAIADALAQVADLTLSFLALSFGVLLLASLAQTLEAQRAAESFLSSADGLVPGAGAAVGVVLCDALGADRVAANVGPGVGDVLAGVCFGFLLLGLVLVIC